MKYSIVIPLYNQLELLKWHIKIFNIIYTMRQDFEVIFSDDGSSDGTKEWIDDVPGIDFPYKYSWKPDIGFTIARAKNVGIQKSEGEWVIVIDGDTFLDPKALKVLDKECTEKDVCYNAKRYPIESSELERGIKQGFLAVALKHKDFREPMGIIPPFYFTHFSGGFFVCYGDTLRDVGYCPSSHVGYGYDDYIFAMIWMVSGFDPLTRGTKRIIKPSEAVAFHADDKPKEGSKEGRQSFQAYRDKYSNTIGVIYDTEASKGKEKLQG